MRGSVDALQRRSALFAHFGWLRMLLLLSNMQPLFGLKVHRIRQRRVIAIFDFYSVVESVCVCVWGGVPLIPPPAHL